MVRKFLAWSLALSLTLVLFPVGTWAVQETTAPPEKPAEQKQEEGSVTKDKTDKKDSDSEQEEEKTEPEKPVEFVAKFNARFLKEKPLVGDKLPNLKAFDEQGNPIDLNDRKGKHPVVVFGCLT